MAEGEAVEDIAPPDEPMDPYILSSGARRLQTDPIFAKVVHDLRQEIMSDWIRAPSMDAREALWHERRALDRVWKKLDKMVADARVRAFTEQRNVA